MILKSTKAEKSHNSTLLQVLELVVPNYLRKIFCNSAYFSWRCLFFLHKLPNFTWANHGGYSFCSQNSLGFCFLGFSELVIFVPKRINFWIWWIESCCFFWQKINWHFKESLSCSVCGNNIERNILTPEHLLFLYFFWVGTTQKTPVNMEIEQHGDPDEPRNVNPENPLYKKNNPMVFCQSIFTQGFVRFCPGILGTKICGGGWLWNINTRCIWHAGHLV